MRPVRLAWALLPLALAACPLPQPLPEIARPDGGTVTPPRVVVASAVPSDVLVRMGTGCPAPGPSFALDAAVDDADTTEAVEARWFVDGPAGSGTGVQQTDAPVATDPNNTLRPLAPFTFTPSAYGATAPSYVVEVVVSNGFLPIPSRSAQPGFETQVYRWVFVYDATSTRCGN